MVDGKRISFPPFIGPFIISPYVPFPLLAFLYFGFKVAWTRKQCLDLLLKIFNDYCVGCSPKMH